ncbi:MAG TPA: GyrI-like domain-containing protein [Gemmatimonadaceae bacterium]|nr:GyrI-like domain-containing protein [Gemmatimonadaceae bacterium]
MTYSVSVQRTELRTIAAVHARVRPGEVPRVFKRYLDQVYAARTQLPLDGQNVFIYRRAADSDDIEAAFGVGVTEAVFEPIGAVRPLQLPSGNVATTAHFGSYAGLGAAHSAVTEWCKTHGHRLVGTSWEVYGHWTEDESKLRTDVFYLLAE